MKILVPVKRVLDFNLKPRIRKDGSDVDLAGSKMSINPFDEIAVEEAIRLKEKGLATEIIAVSIGTKSTEETLRFALALGMDRAILIETQQALFPLDVAKTLAKVVEKEKPDIVLMGKQAIDSDFNQTGQMLAGLLGWPQGTFISQLEVKGAYVEVTREVDEGLETISLLLPAVLTTDLRLNTPRYAALPNIMRAKQKPLNVSALQELGIVPREDLEIKGYTFPAKRQRGETLSGVEELIAKLGLTRGDIA